MKLLLLTNEFALPVNAGGVRRQLGLVEALAGRHEIHMLARQREADTPPALVEELRGRLGGAPVEAFPARAAAWDTSKTATARRWGRAIRRGAPTWTERALSSPLVARARELAPAFDAAVTLDDTAHTYATLVSGVPFVLDKHNVLAWSRRVEHGLAPGARLEYELLRRWEATTVAAAGAVVVTSDDEAQRFRALYGGEPTVVPSAIPVPARVADPAAAERAVVWLGDHRYAPNADGLVRFARAWGPLGEAGARLLVVGRDPTPAVRELASLPGVEILGFVDDLDALLAGCRAAVAPVWEGAGIKMKTLTLMGAGLPVAGTGVAFEGIAVRDDHDGLVADDPEHLAAALRRVLETPAEAARIGLAAHETIVRDHTWGSVVERYDDALARAVSSGRPAG